MQNTFRDAALFEPILVFKASRDQLQPQYRRPSILRISLAYDAQAMPGQAMQSRDDAYWQTEVPEGRHGDAAGHMVERGWVSCDPWGRRGRRAAAACLKCMRISKQQSNGEEWCRATLRAQGGDKVSLRMESKKTYGSPQRLARVLLTSMPSFVSPLPGMHDPLASPSPRYEVHGLETERFTLRSSISSAHNVLRGKNEVRPSDVPERRGEKSWAGVGGGRRQQALPAQPSASANDERTCCDRRGGVFSRQAAVWSMLHERRPGGGQQGSHG
ncbi:hypothetical protein DFH08DRAFT_935768 [Mycena albidolilacea]|uniref:Uncharacterized protein n=1 Tax=Mycena albidolilacea TaxID=1033008 RepID=A0AAD7A5E1_9AGAR|nr:hypothetical protein DFH08DRAFT_935768 [Mycena albidolilacea]